MTETKSEPLFVRQLPLGPMKNFVYLVGTVDGRECFVIDPAWDVEAVLAAAEQEGRTIVAAMVTHHHHDHLNGLEPLLEAIDVPIYVQAAERRFASKVFAPFGDAVRSVEAHATVRVAGLEVQCLHTPGHTPGAQCLHCGGALFSGDTVFVNACGRCDFEGSDPKQMYHSLFDTLGRLPGETALFPGHDYGDVAVSSLARERARNPYFGVTSAEAFVALRAGPRPPPRVG